MGRTMRVVLLVIWVASNPLPPLVSGFPIIVQMQVPAVCLAKRSCAIYKPRGVLSAAADTVHPTLTSLMVAAGLEPLRGHIGRLDISTSGLIMVTDDCALHEGAHVLSKRYSLLVVGRHLPDSDPIASLAEPLTFTRKNEWIHSDAAVVRHRRSFQDIRLRKHSGLLDRLDGLRMDQELARVSARSRDGQMICQAVGGEGGKEKETCNWLTEIEVEIKQGRHHQIRRLCRRAGLDLIHLRRLAFGPLSLHSLQLEVGEVRELTPAEKDELYSACMPAVLQGCERRAVSARIADDRARRKSLRQSFRAMKERRH